MDRHLPSALPWLLQASAALVLIACGDVSLQQTVTTFKTRAECPITEDTLITVTGGTGVIPRDLTEMPVSKAISHVPEFHDCQRFLVSGAGDTLRYDSLYAVFASDQLDSLGDTLSRTIPRIPPAGPVSGRPGVPPIPMPSLTVTRSLTFAQIASWGGNYPTLGIKPGFNCLYLYVQSGTWKSFMVNVNTETSCLTPLHQLVLENPTDITGWKALEVRRNVVNTGIVSAAFAGTDYPPVARWDWDTVNTRQYVGLRCGPAWCEVGNDGFVSSPPGPAPGTFARLDAAIAPTTLEVARTSLVRGWSDFQRLALQSDNVVTPSAVYGWLYPNPRLGAGSDPADFEGEWKHVATAVVTASYVNSVVTLNAGANEIKLCRGTSCPGAPATMTMVSTCPATETWWSEVNGNYRRVCRRDHSVMAGSPFVIPGTARWRWLAADETTWTRCMQGCFQRSLCLLDPRLSASALRPGEIIASRGLLRCQFALVFISAQSCIHLSNRRRP